MPTTYKNLQKTCLKIKSAWVCVSLGLRIHCAHPKDSFFSFPLQLGSKLLVISQLTMSSLGVLRRHCIPLAIDSHIGEGVNISSSNSKNSSSSSKVGRPELAQSNTYIRLTQDRHMQCTMKNLAFRARYVRCAIIKTRCVSRVRRFGFRVHLQHWPTSGWIGYITPAILGSPTLHSKGQNQ